VEIVEENTWSPKTILSVIAQCVRARMNGLRRYVKGTMADSSPPTGSMLLKEPVPGPKNVGFIEGGIRYSVECWKHGEMNNDGSGQWYCSTCRARVNLEFW
jgi:hypothetical protein